VLAVWWVEDEGKELEKRSSVNLHCRNGTREGCLTSDDTVKEECKYHLGIVMIVTLHLKTLAQVHQALIDFPGLC